MVSPRKRRAVKRSTQEEKIVAPKKEDKKISAKSKRKTDKAYKESLKAVKKKYKESLKAVKKKYKKKGFLRRFLDILLRRSEE